MVADRPWWVLPTGWFADLGSTRKAGELSAVLFVLCGSLVALTAPLMPGGPQLHRAGLVAVGATAVAAGVITGRMPWKRWPRHSTLWLVPLAFACIAAHNWASGGDGLRYAAFFFVVAAWVGLMHPTGTATRVMPGMVIAYLAPAFALHDVLPVAASLTYAVPVFVLIGECASFVAERMRASEADLRHSEQRFRALVQNSSDVIVVADAEGNVVWDSPSVTAVLGYQPGEIVGASAFTLLHTDSVELATTTLAALLGNPGTVRRIEAQVRHRDGRWRWCDVTARNMLHEPAVRGLVVNVVDVTERHEQLTALADREASFRLLFSANPQPMWLYDATTLQFLEVNDAAVHHYGYSHSEFLSMTILDIRTPADRVRLEARLTVGHESGDARRSEGW
jgi:PAS domain S-box-containing protein